MGCSRREGPGGVGLGDVHGGGGVECGKSGGESLWRETYRRGMVQVGGPKRSGILNTPCSPIFSCVLKYYVSNMFSKYLGQF